MTVTNQNFFGPGIKENFAYSGTGRSSPGNDDLQAG